ncbi:TonB-dependent receptor [Algihabitans albus]|uniref:TonB-dependent receptor n=1 Tax=Algihabitans albus TaxID=2164067 RepID=UPI000E5D3CC1|nr:TonB-dependent receptor [Algihabitans albus]
MGIGRIHHKFAVVLTAALLSAAGGSSAQEVPFEASAGQTMALEPIVNTATRAPRPVSAIPGSVIVIDRQQIEQQLSISKDPTDILSKLVPGFSSSNQTVSGSAENFRGRGVQVLVDGVSRNTPLRDVSRIISLIDLNQIERIEIVNGASSIYGNGATGGIVNFITKDSTDGAPTVTASVGLRAFTADVEDSLAPEASVGISGDAELFDYFAVISAEATNETFDGNGDRLPDDPLLGQGAFGNSESYNGLIKLGRDFGSRRLQVSAEVTRFDQDPDFFTDYSTEPASVDFSAPYTGRNIYEDSNYQAVEFTDGDFPLGSLTVRAFRNDIEKRFADARLSAANTLVYISQEDGQTTFNADQLGIRTTVDTKLDEIYESLTLTWGFDYTYDETTQEFQDGVEAIAPMSQNSYAGFLQAEVSPLDWLLVRGGVRYERFDLEIDDFTRPSYRFLQGNGAVFTLAPVDVVGGDTSYDELVFNLGAVVFLTDEVEVFGAFSQGYSLPDVGGFTRRAGQNLPFGGTVDFSDIAPEAQLVDNYEIGVRGNWNRLRGSLSGYLSQSELGTNFDVSTNEVVQQEERIVGVEAVLEGDVTDRLTLGGVFSWSEGKRDTDDDGQLDSYLPNNRIGPPLRLTGYVDYKTDFDLDLRLEAVYSGARDRNDGVERVEIENTITFNFAADYPVFGGNLGVGVENLLDTDYENPTASASRNRPVNGFGRTVGLRYSRVF